MKCISVGVGFALIVLISPILHAADAAKPVRMGSGPVTFDTVPGWGLLPDGKSALGPTHGGVVVSKDGNIYTSAAKGVVVFSPEGKVVNSFLGETLHATARHQDSR